MIYTQESEESSWHDFKYLPQGIKDLILKEKCINCDTELKNDTRKNKFSRTE